MSMLKPQVSFREENASPIEDFMTSRIHRAICKGDSHKVLSVIRKGENALLQDGQNKTTYLHLVVIMANSATEDKFLPMIYILSNYNVDPNKTDKRERTPLQLAINKELKHIMVALIRIGTDLMDKDYKVMIQSMQSPYQSELLDMYEKYEPGLWGAVKKNSAGMVHMLANSWCRISTAKNGKPLLYYARLMRKSQDIIEVLEGFDSTIEFVHATLAGDETRMLKYLMDTRGTDPYIMDISYQENLSAPLIPRSLRDTALDMGHTHILHLIPEALEDSSDTDTEYDIGIGEHNLIDENDDDNDEQHLDITPTNSEYSESITNSVESTPTKTSEKMGKYKYERSLSTTESNTSLFGSTRQKTRLTPSNADDNFYYFKSHGDRDTEELFHPDKLLHEAQLSAREYKMNWDSENNRPIPSPRKSKKKKRSIKIKKKKINAELENIKSKMCVIS